MSPRWRTACLCVGVLTCCLGLAMALGVGWGLIALGATLLVLAIGAAQ